METLNHIIRYAYISCLTLAFIITLITVSRFKEILIKLVALEVLVNLFICGIGIWTLHIKLSLLLDICIALSLIMFLSTVACCQFLLKRGIYDT